MEGQLKYYVKNIVPDTSLILSIETATGCGSVALTKGSIANGKLLAEATAQPEVTHSRRLLGSVDWVMEAAGIGWSDLASHWKSVRFLRR